MANFPNNKPPKKKKKKEKIHNPRKKVCKVYELTVHRRKKFKWVINI